MKLTPAAIAKALRPVLLQSSGIAAAYLFGSAAMGRLRPGSDIDIALLLDEEENSPNRKALLDQLLPPVSRALRRDVHILFLNDASYVARSQVLKTANLFM